MDAVGRLFGGSIEAVVRLWDLQVCVPYPHQEHLILMFQSLSVTVVPILMGFTKELNVSDLHRFRLPLTSS